MTSNSRPKSTHRAEPLQCRHCCAAKPTAGAERPVSAVSTEVCLEISPTPGTLLHCHISRLVSYSIFSTTLIMSTGKCKKIVRTGKWGRMVISQYSESIFFQAVSAQRSTCRVTPPSPPSAKCGSQEPQRS